MAILATLLLFTLQLSLFTNASANCDIFDDCDEIKESLLSSTNKGVVNVCAASTPIECGATLSDGGTRGKIYLNDDSNPPFKLNCITNAVNSTASERCIIDFESSENGGFVLQKENDLTIDGFEFVNFQGNGQIFFNQEGSKLSIKNSIFRNNAHSGTGKNPIIVLDLIRNNLPVATVIENSLFVENKGSLLGFQAGDATLKNNIFYDNSLPEGTESNFAFTSFIFWKKVADAKFIVDGNHFHSFVAPLSSGVHDKFFMISASEKPGNTTNLFADVGSGNCAVDNNVAGSYINSGLIPNGPIPDCNDGIYGTGTFPNVECMSFGPEPCPDYGESGPPLPSVILSSESRLYFLFKRDTIGVDLVPDEESIILDQTTTANISIFEGQDDRNGKIYYGVPPLFYPEDSSECSPPTANDIDLDLTWPGKGCTCFEPNGHIRPQISYFDMSDQKLNSGTYRTAYDTSITGGVTVAGWFKAGNTSGIPWNAAPNHPGQQTSLIFVRGEKASWKAGYNLGMGNWNSFRFEVILRGPEDNRYPLNVQSVTNAYPGIDVWHYVIGVYDAVLGRASLYVDNHLIASKSVPFNWERWEKDIQWIGSDSEISKTRIGNGYDSNSKNFFGCTGGFAVYGEAIKVSDSPLVEPTPLPTLSPTLPPTLPPTPSPTLLPTASPTSSPTVSPTPEPTLSPTLAPTPSPTLPPTASPTSFPTVSPTPAPTASPTPAPTPGPTSSPTLPPTPVLTQKPNAAPAALDICEAKVKEVCGTDMSKYGRLISCAAKTIKKVHECKAAITLEKGNGIGAILSDETMYWRANRPNPKLRRKLESTGNLCGDAVFVKCGDECISSENESTDESKWFTCLDQYIYGSFLNECNKELTDEAAWDTIGATCGFYN